MMCGGGKALSLSLSGTNVDDGALMLPDVITAAPRHITGSGCRGLHVAGATRDSSEVEPLHPK